MGGLPFSEAGWSRGKEGGWDRNKGGRRGCGPGVKLIDYKKRKKIKLIIVI